jgi:hypothetical protein
MKATDLKNSILEDQKVEISISEATELLKIKKACEIRDLKMRFSELNKLGYSVSEKPMKTGFGVADCVKRMSDGTLRVRVSANWTGGHFCNYANCIHI